MKTKNKSIVIANIAIIMSENIEEYSFYPTQLYSITPNEKVVHYYLDLFYYNNFDFYKSYVQPFFGDNYDLLLERMLKCTDENIVFLSTDGYNQILKKYLLVQHQRNFTFKKTNSSLNYFDIHTYKVSITD
jgi:hypothetical protein